MEFNILLIQRAVKVREGMDNWLRTNPEIGRTKLGGLRFSEEEWQSLERVSSLLGMLESASKMMSGKKYPTLSYVMPIFIELFTSIERESATSSDDDPMAAPLAAAHKMLSKYYSFSDDSPYYLIAVLLEPRFKRKYLEQKGFDTGYPGIIDMSMSRLTALVHSIKESQCTEERTCTVLPHSEPSSLLSNMFSHCLSDGFEMNEIETYFSLRCEDPPVDPIYYWKAHSLQFPSLSVVAKHILSIPGSSVSVERLFNCGRHTIGLRRHSMKPETLSALMFAKNALKLQ